MQRRNKDIRDYIKASNIYTYEIANKLHIHENTLYRILRKELDDKQKKKIYEIIEKIKEDKNVLQAEAKKERSI